MTDILKLNTVLLVLNSHINKSMDNLSEEDMNYFRSELIKLKESLQSTHDSEGYDTSARNFFSALSRIEYFEELAKISQPRLRSSKLEDDEEQIRLKLISSAMKILEIIDGKKGNA